MANATDQSISLPPDFKASRVAKAVNVCWFSSLMLGIFAALFGIFVKQWLHTYNNWSDIGNPREAVMLRSAYLNSLFAWHISEILSVLPLLLQLALVLFIVGLTAYLWTLDTIVAIFASVFALVGSGAVLAVVFLPLWYEDCAYKSPLAFFVVRWRRGLQETKWRLYDLERVKEAHPDFGKKPLEYASCELERLLDVTPSDGNESLSDDTLISTRVNELESYSESAPFQLLGAIITHLSATPPQTYANTSSNLSDVVKVFSVVARCKKYTLRPEVAAGIVKHVCYWEPSLSPDAAITAKRLNILQTLHDSLLHYFGAEDRDSLRRANFDMLAQSLDQWAALVQSQTDTGTTKDTNHRVDKMIRTGLTLQANFNLLSKPLILPQNSQINVVAYSSDGLYIAAALDSGQIAFWHAYSHRLVTTLEADQIPVLSMSFSRDSKYLASASASNSIYIWDIGTGTVVCALEGHTGGVPSCTFSADGSELISGSNDCTVRVWKLEDAAGKVSPVVLEGHTSHVQSVACSHDGLHIVSGSMDDTIRIWNAKTHRHIRTLQGHVGTVRSVAISPDSHCIISGSWDHSVCMWDVDTGAQLRILNGHSAEVHSVAFSPQGMYILSSSSDNTMRIWDANTGKELRTLDGHPHHVYAATFSPDGRHIISGSDDRTIKRWSTNLPVVLTMLQDATAGWQLVAFSPDGKYIAFTVDNKTRVWETTTGKQVSSMQGHDRDVKCASFSHNATHLVTGAEDDTVRIWDVRTGGCLKILAGHRDWVRSVSFSHDGTFVASGSDDSTTRIWNASTGELVKLLAGHTDNVRSVAFSTDGEHIVSGSDDHTLRIWDTNTAQSIELSGHNYIDRVHSVAFSPKGGQVASGSNDNTIRVWDAHSGTELAVICHNSPVLSVAFSSDGRYITSVDARDRVCTWSAPHDFPLDVNPSSHPLPPAAPIFTFDSNSGYIYGRRDVQSPPERLFWVIPQLRPQGRIWTCGHKVMLKAKSGVTTVLNFDCRI